MDENFDIQAYMTRGVERIVADSLRAALKDPRESAFMVKFAAASRKASKIRAEEEKNGVHIPPFLIASITSSCNLHCAGCYSRCNHATQDSEPVSQLTSEEWLSIFKEADEIGVSYILLAGGEPLLRRDIIEAAGKMQNIIFPIFTNGTYIDEKYLNLFDKCRNLIPVMSIEGGKEETDIRRGRGVYDKLISAMDSIYEKGLLFGASVTVTTENAREVVSDAFIDSLAQRGCKLVVYVEFVPVTEESKELAPGEAEREFLKDGIGRLREEYSEMVFVSFPGDEKSSGGCIAAGRGFFHINSHGGAEPCPFSPYSDTNVKNTSLREALESPLFTALREQNVLMEEHSGGCVLFERRETVEALLTESVSK
ncbi:MAG: radical SAM protein [Lachnospiraceae bacterium]|nr:radical SAM protein [Lachnospiraceae bacterium]